MCSGTDKTSPPVDPEKSTKTGKSPGKIKKVNYGAKEPAAIPFVMNEEETKIMQARNKLDGGRAKLKPKEQPTKKQVKGE